MKWISMLKALPLWRQAIYVIAVIAAFALLIWDIVDQSAQYAAVGVLVCVVIGMVALRAPNPT